MGPGVVPGRYAAAVALNDAAPTLSTILNIPMPSASAGRVLIEALQPGHTGSNASTASHHP